MLPDHLPNHDTGDDGYGHYGYVKANGCWVDPDDQNARKAAAGGLGASYVPDLPIGINPIPPPAEDELYAGFVNEVTDGLDGDGEWDPRATYITPATFARWAAGASQGDKYVRGKVDTEVSYILFYGFISLTEVQVLMHFSVTTVLEAAAAASL